MKTTSPFPTRRPQARADVSPVPSQRPGSARRKELSQFTTTIRIPAPLELVYAQWTLFEAFPHFMQGVGKARKADQGRMVWRIEFHGDQSPFEAEVCEQVPRSRIVWRNISGRPCPHTGAVRFESLAADVTDITVEMEFELPAGVDPNAAPFRSVISLVEWSLERFRNYIRILAERLEGLEGDPGAP